jgi:hypothetical protein
MAKVGIGNKIGEDYIALVDEIHSTLGGNKFRIYEAALDLFNAVHPLIQQTLISYDEESRQLLLEIIGQLKYPPDKGKGGKKS